MQVKKNNRIILCSKPKSQNALRKIKGDLAVKQNNYIKMTREHQNYRIAMGMQQRKSIIKTEKEQAENYKLKDGDDLGRYNSVGKMGIVVKKI